MSTVTITRTASFNNTSVNKTFVIKTFSVKHHIKSVVALGIELSFNSSVKLKKLQKLCEIQTMSDYAEF